MDWNIEKYVTDCLDTIESAGFEAYIVGGAVRDMYLGFEPDDYDIATNATPEDIIALFPKVLKTGIKHGTVTVIFGTKSIEVTTYRGDGDYTDSRHPDSVVFYKKIDKDLSRRDFTINAMAYNPKRGVVDLFGGSCDLKNGILRAVGDPEKRFTEDALRIMRLYRFACRFGFSPESKTEFYALKLCKNLSSVSAERIFSELKNALNSPSPNMLFPLVNAGAFKFAGINSANKQQFERIKNLPVSLEIRLSALLIITKSDIQSLDILKSDNALKQSCKNILKAFTVPTPDNDILTRKYLRDYGKSANIAALIIKRIIYGEDTAASEEMLQNVLNSNCAYRISDLKVNGNDLKNLGLCGEKIGDALNYLLDRVIEKPELNKKETLINLITK